MGWNPEPEPNPHQIVALTGSLSWPSYWKNVSKEQQSILDVASTAIRKMAIALEEIDHLGMHICRGDTQLPDGIEIRTKEAKLAFVTLREVRALIKDGLQFPE